MEKLINYVNSHNKVNMKLLMSTPGKYIDAVKQVDPVWPAFYNDMFPYADSDDEYWTGYFSSRPSAKLSIKHGSASL
jgi:hypothetical protein